MLTTAFIRDNKERVLEGLRVRNYSEDDLKVIDQILEEDDQRKAIQLEMDQIKAQSNSLSKEIGNLYKEGKQAEANELKEQVATFKEQAKEKQDALQETQNRLRQHLLTVPNLPNQLVPKGQSEKENEVYKDWPNPLPKLEEGATPHWELAKKYDLIDFELGVKITGSGFPLYKGKGAKLQRALISFFLDEAIDAGYLEVIPPHLVNAASAMGTGALPDKEGQMYYVSADDLYLIPTAEVPVTNIYRDVTIKDDDFSIKLTGYTPCFRREAGSYGKEVRGLNRVHQFDKIEIVRIEHPTKSYDALKEMKDHCEGLLNKLELPYRILTLCGGDLTFASALTYDFEVYSAAQERWLEVSSVSNFETFQSNRLNLKYKDPEKGNQLAHTLNGSAMALARIVAALLENNQTNQGIRIPEALRRYTGFDLIE